MNKYYIIFLIAIFSSIVLNPLFVKVGIPDNFGVISKVLGQESDGGDSGDDGGDSGDDGGDSGDDGGDSGDDGGDSGDDGG
ncbi:MAG TPA: hypothetical protein VJ772_05695, partial [Nitrososphaeraceae archaeon]|nr:hypothetical protein [Nitrososphaeraceae archaeon]